MVREIPDLPRAQIEQPDLRMTAARRDERDLAAIRRQRGLIVKSRAVGEALESRSIRMCAINVGGSVLRRSEEHPGAVTRERSVPLLGGCGMKEARMRSIGICNK